MCYIYFALLLNCLQGDPLNVKVNKLTSIKTQLPYLYYSIPYCRPNTIIDSRENLGEVLRGDRIENSPYVVCVIIFIAYCLSGILSFLNLLLLHGHVTVPDEGATVVQCSLSSGVGCQDCKSIQRKNRR